MSGQTSNNPAQIITQACTDSTGRAPPEHDVLSKVGKWLRFRVPGDKGRAKSGAVKVIDKGGYYVFIVKNHRESITRTGSTKTGKRSLMTPQEKATAQRQRAQIEREQRERSQCKRQRLIPRARKLWNVALKIADWPGPHTYLMNKGIPPLNCRRYISKKRDVLLIPMCDLMTGDLVSVQMIYRNSFKRPLRTTETKALCAGIGSNIADASVIWLAEGYSTSVSLHLETGEPVVVAFNCGNLAYVADVLVQRYPNAQIKLMADDDRLTAKKPPRFVNPGIAAAKKVQARHPAISLHRPLWPPGAPESLSDINDLVLWENQQNGGVN